MDAISKSPPEEWFCQAHKVLAWAHEKLLTNPTQMDCLKRRGIDWYSISRHVLGWNPGQWGRDILRDPKEWGLTDWEEKLCLPIGLVVPHFERGRVVRLRFQRLEGDTFLMQGSASQCLVLGNPSARSAIIVEDELDAILLDQEAGDLTHIVAVGSAEERPDKQTLAMLGHHEKIFVVCTREFSWWKNRFKNAKRLSAPEDGEIDVRGWIFATLYQQGCLDLK